LTYEPNGYYFAQSPQGDATRIYNYVRLVRDVGQDLPPIAEAGGPYGGAQGSTITLDGSASADADGTIVLYEWNHDNDGQYDDGIGVTASFFASSVGAFIVGLRVTDDDDAQSTDTATVTVYDPAKMIHEVHLPLVMKDAESSSNVDDDDDSDGFNLFAPLRSTTTYLMDSEKNIVHTWESAYTPGNSVYLLENGNLLRTGNTRSQNFNTGGAGGIVQEIAPNGAVLWEFEYDSNQYRQHHDIEPLPNGNVLMVAWEFKMEAEAIAAGRNPSLLNDGELWPDHIIEVDPTNDTIVWEWYVWDHLIQDYAPTKANYGVVADHPELIDLNFTGGPRSSADWNHINAIDYNEKLDQILLSVHSFGEIWVIDHSTTTAEAAGQAGDLLYRWGNPRTYDAGTASDQQLFVQHDAQWIPSGYPGEENILIFNNGTRRSGGNYSSVDEIVPPVDGNGNYTSDGPAAPTWTYTADNPTDFYAERVSGAQRLANGNTLICDGVNGVFFEVTPEGEIIWEYDLGDDVFRVTRYAPSYPGIPD
jgi:hypothetical protein